MSTATQDIKTHKTFCVICEATCGLEVDVKDNRVTDIRANQDHVVSKGHLCVKGKRFGSIQHSPDRVTSPLKRVGDSWQTISWDQAINEILSWVRVSHPLQGARVLYYIADKSW